MQARLGRIKHGSGGSRVFAPKIRFKSATWKGAVSQIRQGRSSCLGLGMTATDTQTDAPTSAQLMAMHDGRQRAEADRTKQPVPRATWSVFAENPLTVHNTGLLSIVSIDSMSGALVLATYTRGSNVPAVTRGKGIAIALRDAVEGVYWHEKSPLDVEHTGTLAFADKKSLRTAARVLKKAKDPGVRFDSFSTAGKRLDFRSHLSFGHRFPVITEGLAHKFYAPADMDTDSIFAWGKLFGLDSGTDSGLYGLYATAAESDQDRPASVVKGIRMHEQNAVSMSVYSAAKSACKAFDATVLLLSHCEALVALDPMLRERNVLQGVLTEMKFQSRNAAHVTVRIESVCNLRENSDVWVIDGRSNEVMESTVKSIGFVTDTLTARLSAPSGMGSQFLLHNEKNYKPLYVLSKPFFAVPFTKSGNDWAESDTGEYVEDREVPLVIALAGAPTV